MVILALLVGATGCEYVLGVNGDRALADCNVGQHKCAGTTAMICSAALTWVPDPSAGDTCSTRVVQVAAGGQITCALKVDQTVWCWGGNDGGALGLGTFSPATSPVPRQVRDATGKGTLRDVVALAAGYQHACAVTGDRSVWCWGANGDGELGNGSSTDSNLPVRVLGPDGNGFLAGARTVACGEFQTCAITVDRTLYCWGGPPLGAGGTMGSWVPVKVAVPPVDQVALGASGTICARDANMGSLYCWGTNTLGEVGNVNPSVSPEVLTPSNVGSMYGEVGLGSDHTCAIQPPFVLCWGADDDLQLGIGPTDTCPGLMPCSVAPVIAGGPHGTEAWPAKVTDLALGQAFTCARTEASSVYCWGAGTHGELGNGSPISSTQVAVQVLGVGGEGTLAALQISSGCDGSHACALRADGTMVCWGDNPDGQLGDGTMMNHRLSPVLVPPF